MELLSQASKKCMNKDEQNDLRKRISEIVFRARKAEGAKAEFGELSEIALHMVDLIEQSGAKFPLPVTQTASFAWPEGTDEIFVAKEGDTYRLLEPCRALGQ